MSSSYDDPFYQPPADIQGAEARAYEEKVLELMRDAMLPDHGAVIRLEAIELRGERPETEVIFIYTDTREPGQHFAKRTWLWKDPFRWPLQDDPRFADTLNEPASVAAHVGGAFSSHECDLIELPDSSELRR
ncbi:MAG: hypothetical protein WAU75_05900 [Solirubrobacteraceae bacterium]